MQKFLDDYNETVERIARQMCAKVLGDGNHADCDQEHWRRSARKILAQIQADPELADLYRFCGWLV